MLRVSSEFQSSSFSTPLYRRFWARGEECLPLELLRSFVVVVVVVLSTIET